MKKIIFSLLMTTVVLSGILFYLTSCQKQQEGLNKQTNNQISIDDESQAMTSHVLAFKAKMEYYRNNPDLKTGGELYSADSAVLELESLLNYNFCYTGIECNKKTFELLQKAQTTSVFQLESDGMKKYLKDLKPTCLDDIIAMVALYRPGDIDNGLKAAVGRPVVPFLQESTCSSWGRDFPELSQRQLDLVGPRRLEVELVEIG